MKPNRDLITEQEFNRIVMARPMPLPGDDSKGDSDTDNAVEIELGEHYLDGNAGELDEIEEIDEPEGDRSDDDDDALIETRTSAYTDAGGERSSTWPERSDLDDVPMKSAIDLGDLEDDA